MQICPYGAGTGGGQRIEGGSQMDTGEAERTDGGGGTSSASAGEDTSRVRTRSDYRRAAGGDEGIEGQTEQHEQLGDRQQQEEEVEADESLLDTNSGEEAEESGMEDSAVFYSKREEETEGTRSTSVPDLTDSEAEVTSMKTVTGSDKDTARRLSLGSDYRTVQAARDAASCVRHLNPSPHSTESVSTSSFSREDERILLCQVGSNLQARTTVSSTFDQKTKKCVVCIPPGHSALKSVGGGPVVLVGSDQCFPACLPVMNGGECLRVVRVEDGSLQEVTHALSDAIGTVKLHGSTVVLLGSISHLGKVGTQQYITDWVRSRWWIKNRLGEQCMVLPLVPVPVQGIQGAGLIRALLETLHWFTALSATESLLVKDILSRYCNTYITLTEGTDNGNSRQCFRVPAGLDTKAYVSLVSEGWGSIPDCIPPLSRAAEEQIVLALITKLNSSFDVGLSTEPRMERTKEEMRELHMEHGAKKLVAVVGGSHAGRVAEKLLERDMQLISLTQPGWKASRRSVELVVGELTSLDPPPDVVVLQCLDNSAYFCLNENGTLTLPERSLTDGRYHIREDLKIAS